MGRYVGLNKIIGGYQERWFVLKKHNLYAYKKKESKQACDVFYGNMINHIAKEGKTKIRFVNTNIITCI